MRGSPALWLICALITGGCGDAGDGVVPIAPTTSSLEIVDGIVSSGPTEVIVLVVDDAPTAEAADLRAHVVESVRSGMVQAAQERWYGGCSNPDPAIWHTGDVRFVVVRPSAPDALAIRSPVQAPALAWITRTSTEAEAEAVTAAAAAALEDRLAAAGEAFRPLHAAQRAIELLGGARAAETDDENALVASLPADFVLRPIVAATRDDGDAAPALEFSIDAQARTAVFYPWVVGPFEPKPGTCSIDAPGAVETRLERWGRALDAELMAWPCDDMTMWGWLLGHLHADCSPWCHARRLAVDPNGAPRCRIHVDQRNLGACDPERGWKDPGGEPTFVERNGVDLRRCDIVELGGGCISSLECPGCGSGYCATEVAEVVPTQVCEAGGQHAWPLRFIGGALEVDGWIHLECETAD
jgi:hypothetical protein